MYVEVRQGQMLRQAPKKRGRASTGEGRGGGEEQEGGGESAHRICSLATMSRFSFRIRSASSSSCFSLPVRRGGWGACSV